MLSNQAIKSQPDSPQPAATPQPDALQHDNLLCPSNTDLSVSIPNEISFTNSIPFPISPVDIPLSSYNQNIDFILNYGLFNVNRIDAEHMLFMYCNNTEPTFLLRYTEYSEHLTNNEIATLTLKVNDKTFIHMYLYTDSYKSVLDTFKNNGYKYFTFPNEIYVLFTFTKYNTPDTYLYVRNDILIIDRDDCIRILQEDTRDNIYLLRYKKIDKYYTPNTAYVLSIKRNMIINHHIITQEELLQTNTFLQNFKKVQIASPNSKNLGY